MSTFGQNVRATRVFLSMSRSELARRMSYRYSTSIAVLELSPKCPMPRTILAAAFALQTSTAALLDGVVDPYLELRDNHELRIRAGDPPIRRTALVVGRKPSGHQSQVPRRPTPSPRPGFVADLDDAAAVLDARVVQAARDAAARILATYASAPRDPADSAEPPRRRDRPTPPKARPAHVDQRNRRSGR